MRTFWKAAAVLVALGAAACSSQAQTYDDRYYGNDSASGYPGAYDDGYYDDAYDDAQYGQDAYGYCDAYGCPGDYWNLPVYYGSIFYGDAWIDGPLYYRDWGGSRQYWVRGGWRYDTWRGARPDRYRNARYGPALGLSWYRSNHVYRQGWHGGGSYRGRVYRAPQANTPPHDRGIRNSFSNRNGSRFQSGANSHGRTGDRPAYRGNRSGNSQGGYSGNRHGGQAGRSAVQSRGSGGSTQSGSGRSSGGGRHR